MPSVRAVFIPLRRGDVEVLGVIHLGDHTRLEIHERRELLATLHVELGPEERQALIRALQDCPPQSGPARRPYRIPRSRACAQVAS